MPVQKQQGIRKALKDIIIGSLERTVKLVEKGREHQVKPIKGKKQRTDPDDGDLGKKGMDDVVDVMENAEAGKVFLPIQVARADMERWDALKKEQDRLEQVQGPMGVS